jgi:hypothetical protein
MVNRLQIVSDNYYRFLSKKKALDDLPEEPGKLSARDAFGIVMISHGEEFGEDSAFGALLCPLACRVSHRLNDLQERPS